jgi:hypothetical protein
MSAPEFLKAAMAEEESLLAQLRATELFKRLEAVRKVVAVYQALVDAEATIPLTVVTVPPQTGRGFKTAAIVSNTAAFLRAHKRRATSGEITRMLQQTGILGADASAKLVSSYLSNSDLFDNDEGGYGLVEWKKAAAE